MNPFLTCLSIPLLLTTVEAFPVQSTTRPHLSKRITSIFPHNGTHSNTQNTVHVIAAVIGIVGAVLLLVGFFIYLKRKRRLELYTANSTMTEPSTLKPPVINTTPPNDLHHHRYHYHHRREPSSTSQFQAFQSDYYHEQSSSQHFIPTSSPSHHSKLHPPPPPYQL